MKGLFRQSGDCARRARTALFAAALLAGMVACDGGAGPVVTLEQSELLPLPVRVANNAVASVTVGDDEYLLSFAGLGPGKTHADTHAQTWVRDPRSGAWLAGPAVPGGVGRLAAVAVAVGEVAYVFGGYTVAADGSEVSTPWTHAFDPVTLRYSERPAMPVPVDDAMAVTYRDRYVYLVSGWHDLGNVNLVQLYDTQTSTWSQATPTPGRGVFGHAGGSVGQRIVYCDGVAVLPHADRARDFVANDECYLGLIDEADPRRVDWRVLPAHPGPARYRMAAAGIPAHDAVLFIGGSDNPYNYDGIGYDGSPSAAVDGGWWLDLDSLEWRPVAHDGPASMDHRGLVPLQGGWATIGGVRDPQRVSDAVVRYSIAGEDGS